MSHDPHSTLDPGRLARQGFPEIVYCQSKTVSQIIDNLRSLAGSNGNAFGTRLQPERAPEVLAALPEATYDALGRTIALGTFPQAGARHVAAVALFGFWKYGLRSPVSFQTKQPSGSMVQNFRNVSRSWIGPVRRPNAPLRSMERSLWCFPKSCSRKYGRIASR